MVADATEALKALGLSKNRRRTPGQITVEKYW
jgi:ferredoxin--NADP+ reductase